MSQTHLCVAIVIATVNWMKETLMSENPKLHYFHSIVYRSSIYFIKYRSCQSNLCHSAFGVCSCRSHLDVVGIRKPFLCPRVWLQTLAFVGPVGKPHPSPLPSVCT